MRFLTKLSCLAVALLGLCATCGSANASAVNIYIAQSAAGSANGSSCANAFAYSFFNSGSNWGSGAAQIGPGTTVHLCGTITSVLSVQGNGSSAGVVTILFESGAQLSEPVCPYSGCLALGSHSYITVNGGTNGILQNTANGSALANQSASEGIVGGGSYITIENLTIQNLYVQTTGDSKLGDSSTVRCISWQGSNWTITNNTLHDAGWCLDDFYNNGDSNVTISNNNIYAVGHGIAFATSGANSFTNLVISGNHIHDVSNWADSGCSYHDDGMHFFGTAGSSMSGIYVYNNLIDGLFVHHRICGHRHECALRVFGRQYPRDATFRYCAWISRLCWRGHCWMCVYCVMGRTTIRQKDHACVSVNLLI